MIRKFWLIIFTISILNCFNTSAVADNMMRVLVNGVSVRVYGTSDLGYVVIAGNQLVIQEDTAFVGIVGIFEGNGHTYVVISENCGGSACGDVFQAVDMTRKPYVSSPVFGTGVSGAKFHVQDGALVLTQLDQSTMASESYSFKDGKLAIKRSAVNVEPTGPVSVPGGDMAAFAFGKSMSVIFKTRATAAAIVAIMGEASFREARNVALQDFGNKFTETYGLTVGQVCEPHNCGFHSIAVAFDHEGGVWVKYTQNGLPQFFGNPDSRVKYRLNQ